MATLALGLVGTAIGGLIPGSFLGITAASALGFVGATIGGLIDNLLFGGGTIEGPRLDSLRVTKSAYGQTMALLYGPENRAAGHIIWKSPLKETVKKDKVGGFLGIGGTKTRQYFYSVDVAVLISDRFVKQLDAIHANGKRIFDLSAATTTPAAPTASIGMYADRDNGTHAVFSTIRFYQGNATQDIDPTIEADVGVGSTSAYRHSSYVVITDLQLADFGNALPNLEFFVKADETMDDATIVTDICSRVGVTDIIVSGLSENRRGFAAATEGSAFAVLAPLGLAGNFDPAEERGTIVFAPRGGKSLGTINQSEMGGRDAVNDAAEPIRFTRQPDIAMPQEAVITYFDTGNNLQEGSQRAFRQTGNSDNNLSYDLPIALTADEARAISDRLLFEAWKARRTARFSTWPRLGGLRVGRHYQLEVDESGVLPTHLFKVTRITQGHNGLLDIELRHEDPEVYTSTAAGADSNIPANDLQLPGASILVLMDSGNLPNLDDNGFNWAVTGANAGWRGTELNRSIDGGTSYEFVDDGLFRAAIGTIATALPDGPTVIWDRVNSFDVVLDYDQETLESISEFLALSGNNTAWIGPSSGAIGEYVTFATATLIAAQTYRCSNLLRGRLATDHFTGSHGANERFVLLDGDSWQRSDFGTSDWNKSRLYKPVSILETLADTTAQSFTNTGESKRPKSPVHARGKRDGSDNLTITWIPRTRILVPGLGNGPADIGETMEKYEVDFRDGATVVRTETVTTPTITYTAAQQTTDGLTPGDPVDFDVYMISATRGRGHPGVFKV